MMTDRENFLSIARRQGFEHMPVYFNLCPSLQEKYDAYVKEHPLDLDWAFSDVFVPPCERAPDEVFLKNYYPGKTFRPGTQIDEWGVAYEPGSAAAYHMTHMHHPMEDFDSVEQLLSYPFPTYLTYGYEQIAEGVNAAHAKGIAAMGGMGCQLWETAWYMRGMENLMCDMMEDSDMATVLLDKVTDQVVVQVEAFARAGADAIWLGDDVGTQNAIMMSQSLYGEWLQPRLTRVIDAIRAIKPDTVVFYHSCGHVTELIPQLIEAGVDVLNPVQPECMDFREIHDRFGDQISFHGTIGTQSIMPFGTPDEVRREVFKNLDIAGKHGGLFVAPTHLLEPEVPLENILAYVKACEDYTK